MRSTTLRFVVKALGLCLIGVVATSTAYGRTPAPDNHTVPEIDPGSILSAMALLGGGFMMITDRRRRAK